jgi:hypothetical protein
MEFAQFHPTCLFHPEVKNFLITQAMRGEGGRLTIPGTGHRFMPEFEARAQLAPRDIVARAVIPTRRSPFSTIGARSAASCGTMWDPCAPLSGWSGPGTASNSCARKPTIITATSG